MTGVTVTRDRRAESGRPGLQNFPDELVENGLRCRKVDVSEAASFRVTSVTSGARNPVKNSSEIVRELGITLPTLRNHLHSINEKLRTHNRLEAVMQAMQRGLI